MKDLRSKLNQLKKISKHKKELLINSIPSVLLSLVLIFLLYKDMSVREQIANEPQSLVSFRIKMQPYPLLQNPFVPQLTAQTALIMDSASKVVIYEKNPSFRFSMASTTKIMTTLVALDHYKKDDILVVQRENVEGAVVGFTKGEQVYFEDMLYGLMLPSGNDAAYAIADNYPGGMTAFVAKMNEKAASLGLIHTRYADPAGLEDDDGYTTVVDLANLAAYAMQHEEFAAIVGTKRKTISTVDGSKQYELSNLNKLLGQYGVNGVKTGFTEGAGGVLVTSKIEKGRTFIIVVMKSLDRFADTERLLQFITNNVTFVTPLWYPRAELLDN